MRYIRLGKSGLEVSRLGLDCHSLGIVQRDQGWDPTSYDGQVFAIRTVHAALDAGINVFDTSSDTFGARGESLLGKALHEKHADVLLASRVRIPAHDNEFEENIFASLRRLRSDHIDVLYMNDKDRCDDAGSRPIREPSLEILRRLKEKGTIRRVGLLVSDPNESGSLVDSGQFDLVEMQCEVNQNGAASKILDSCQRQGIGVSIIKPVASKTLQTVVSALDSSWVGSNKVRECCLKFLLSDRRVHLINVGMRWEHEVASNSRLFSDMDDDLSASDDDFDWNPELGGK